MNCLRRFGAVAGDIADCHRGGIRHRAGAHIPLRRPVCPDSVRKPGERQVGGYTARLPRAVRHAQAFGVPVHHEDEMFPEARDAENVHVKLDAVLKS